MNGRESLRYDQELERLADACRAFLAARNEQQTRVARAGFSESGRRQTDEERIAQVYLAGHVTVACSRVYNLSPPGGVLDPAVLFTGSPE